MRIELQLQPEAARELHQRLSETKGASQSGSNAAKLEQEIEKLGLKLEPIHPGQTHELLIPYFMIEAPDRQIAERLVNQLAQNTIVEAAYLRPEESVP